MRSSQNMVLSLKDVPEETGHYAEMQHDQKTKKGTGESRGVEKQCLVVEQ